MQKNTLLALITATLSTPVAMAHVDLTSQPMTAIYADLTLLRSLKVPVLFAQEDIKVGYTVVSGETLQKISDGAHANGRCGNFEALDEIPSDLNTVKKSFGQMSLIQARHETYESLGRPITGPALNQSIVDGIAQLSSENIGKTVTWLSSYPTRFNKSSEPNKHVVDFEAMLKEMASKSNLPVTIDLVTHKKTPQKSVRISIKGSERPNEIIVLGGHLDSIVGWYGGNGRAPGADDNASGSASLLEALRVVLQQPQPQRTVEFMWYAGEESGLLGSAEIAQAYKAANKNVIAVLQLDMTSFAGSGANTIASMTDFTSPWLRDYIKAINETYLNVTILDDKCGYGCSDHASWHKQGYPAVMPTEAKFDNMFKQIHTENDVINSQTNFEHSLIFSKIALIMAMDLSNSTMSQPVF